MKEITSTSNPLIKEISKLRIKKHRENDILIEGKKAVDEAISANIFVKYIFVLNKCESENYQNYPVYLTDEKVMAKISTTQSPPSVLGVFEKPKYDIKQFYKYKKIILLDGIKDAGNLGTIIRAGSAFNFDGILLFSDSVDEFSPKTIRAAAGNIFKIPVLKVTIDELMKFKKTHKFLAAVVNSKNYLNDFKVESNYIIMFGSEAFGLSKELLKIADNAITLKMSNNVESLNLALCAGIFLYELQNK